MVWTVINSAKQLARAAAAQDIPASSRSKVPTDRSEGTLSSSHVTPTGRGTGLALICCLLPPPAQETPQELPEQRCLIWALQSPGGQTGSETGPGYCPPSALSLPQQALQSSPENTSPPWLPAELCSHRCKTLFEQQMRREKTCDRQEQQT